jgi:hypothetical protein
MTTKMICLFVIGQGDIAVFAHGDPGTNFTFQPGGETTAVLKQDNLFFVVKS